MDEGKIVLDRKSFEALAVDTRVRILKSLKERRKTLSEMAKEQGMSVSGVKEHLETLEGVGLIEKKDDGHKWKYYELTKKGAEIVAPRELRVWILLSISAIALLASMVALFTPAADLAPGAGGVQGLAEQEPGLMMATPAEAEAAGSGAADEYSGGLPQDAPLARGAAEAAGEAPPDVDANAKEAEGGGTGQDALPRDMTLPIAVAMISGVTLAACIALLARNRFRAS